jgi:hypothetical protein
MVPSQHLGRLVASCTMDPLETRAMMMMPRGSLGPMGMTCYNTPMSQVVVVGAIAASIEHT